MAYSATLANNRKLLSDEEHRRILSLFSRAGLSMDHHQFDEKILAKATAAILKTRDGLLRAAVPNPLGSCSFLNDVSAEEMNSALRRHKELMKEYPRNGEGIEAYVDSSDTGYTENAKMEEERIIENAAKKAGLLNGVNGHVERGIDSVASSGFKANGFINGKANGALSNGTTGNYTNGCAKVNGD
jgi:3-dehydroquinate synthase